MSDLILLASWFVCGIAGVHIGFAMDGMKEQYAYSVWLALFGPIILMLAVGECIRRATEHKSAA